MPPPGREGAPAGPPAVSAAARAGTKVIATIGPASETRIPELIEAGMSVARLNFSHGEEADHRRRAALVREAAAQTGRAVGILVDIQGPKLRLGQLAVPELELVEGESVRLVEAETAATERELPFNFQGFAKGVHRGDRVFLADAALELLISDVADDSATARVLHGGKLTDRKGVHLPDSNLVFDVPTERDRAHLVLARELGADMIGISFVSRAEEVECIRELVPEMLMVAKIERRLAVENLDSILQVADGLMVARGDLGVEMRFERLPLIQKIVIREALLAGKFSITATEMLESMVKASRPTRAEVTDVANAVLDGTDAVMLSAETAVGDHPVAAVRAMSAITRAIETSEQFTSLPRTPFRASEPTFSNAAALAAARVARALNIGKIICFTESGNTVRLITRYRPDAEVIALTPSERTLNGMTVLARVRPMLFRREASIEDMLHASQVLLLEHNLVIPGEEVVFVAGVPPGVSRSTNMVKLHRIGEMTRMH